MVLPLYTGKLVATEKKTTNTDPPTHIGLFDNAAQMGGAERSCGSGSRQRARRLQPRRRKAPRTARGAQRRRVDTWEQARAALEQGELEPARNELVEPAELELAPRARERERDTHTHTHTPTHRERTTARETDRDREREKAERQWTLQVETDARCVRACARKRERERRETRQARDERREREASERAKEREKREERDESRRGAAAPLQHASRVGSRIEVKNKVV